jgi:hypothetical protein
LAYWQNPSVLDHLVPFRGGKRRKRFVVHADEKPTAFVELESQLVVKGMDFSEKACFAPVAGCTTKAP